MWRRLGRDDFNRPNESLAKRGSIGAEWYVCREYDLHQSPKLAENESLSYYLVPRYDCSSEDDDQWREYKPFEDIPDLFLRFARLYGETDPVESALDWVYRYGVLGLDDEWCGGSEETLQAFWDEVERAAAVLAMYEAALSGDEEAAMLTCERFPMYALMSPMRDDEDHLYTALWVAIEEVTSTVWRYCSPTLCVGEPGGPSGVQSVWGFRSLLGAMYLQMYWLMAASGNVTRCGYCGRIVSLAPPVPGARKVRQDKRFCDDACRQRYHYHNKTKPKRQAKRL